MQKVKRDPIETGRLLRQLRGIRTMTGVAHELDVSYSMLCKIEAGIRMPGAQLMEKIAGYYGVPVDEIFYTIK